MANPTAELLVKVGTDTKALNTGLNSADKQVGGFANTIKKHHKAIGMAMAAMGTAILAAGALSVKQFAKMGDEVQKMALRTGFSTESLSELRHAADLSGASLAGLEKASRTLSGAILDAGYGLETYVRTFDQLGLSYKDLKDLSPEDQFMAVMEALAGVENESARAAIATDLFGRAGTQLLPMLVDGAEGLADMRQEAHDLGIVFDQEAANKAAAFNDALTKLKGSFSGIMITVGGFLTDALKPLVDTVTSAVKKFSDWAKEHPALSKAITYMGIVVGILLIGLGTLLFMLPQLSAAYEVLAAIKWSTIIPAIWAHITALWAQVTASLAAIAATGLGIPIAIAAAAGIALLAAGVTLLVKNQRKQYESTKAVAEATDEAKWATYRWSEEAGKMVKVTEEVTEATKDLGKELDLTVEAFMKEADALFIATHGQEAFEAATNKGTTSIDRQRAALERLRKELFNLARQVGAKTLQERGEELIAGAGGTRVKGVLTPPSWFEGTATDFSRMIQESLLFDVPGFQHGGIVTSPTLAMVGEKGPEAIVPLDRAGGNSPVNIYFNEPVFMEREESINKLADRIHRVIKREQRLSFGGAYSG